MTEQSFDDIASIYRNPLIDSMAAAAAWTPTDHDPAAPIDTDMERSIDWPPDMKHEPRPMEYARPRRPATDASLDYVEAIACAVATIGHRALTGEPHLAAALNPDTWPVLGLIEARNRNNPAGLSHHLATHGASAAARKRLTALLGVTTQRERALAARHADMVNDLAHHIYEHGEHTRASERRRASEAAQAEQAAQAAAQADQAAQEAAEQLSKAQQELAALQTEQQAERDRRAELTKAEKAVADALRRTERARERASNSRKAAA